MSAPAMPATFSDDFQRVWHREESWQVPAEERSTCPDHMEWRDRCEPLHEEAS